MKEVNFRGNSRMSREMNYLSITAIKNYHKCSVLKQHKFIIL